MSLAVVHDPRLRHGEAGTRCQIALRVMHQETVAKRARDKMLSDDLAAPLRHLLPHVAIPVLRCRRIEFADHVTKLFCRRDDVTRHRSEEHTSELQSLMSISYAVICLKKKKNT